MADRFHFNPETGRTGKCGAQVKCRFGQSEAQHGATREEARANYEKTMEPELFANTASRADSGSGSEEKPLSKKELQAVKESFRKTYSRPDGSTYQLWASDDAKTAALRAELELKGYDASYTDRSELDRGNYLYLNDKGTRVVRGFHSKEAAARAGWWENPIDRRALLEAAEARIDGASSKDSKELRRMAEILKTEQSYGYPKPVKRPNRFSEAELDAMAEEFKAEYRYSVQEMLEMRDVDERTIDEADLDDGGAVWMKIPSESEVNIHSELARHELKKLQASRRERNRGLYARW